MTEKTKELRNEKEEKIWELRNMLIQLLVGLGMSDSRIIGTIMIIAKLQAEQKMVSWVATFYGKENTLTIQSFTAKLNELIAEKQTNGK